LNSGDQKKKETKKLAENPVLQKIFWKTKVQREGKQEGGKGPRKHGRHTGKKVTHRGKTPTELFQFSKVKKVFSKRGESQKTEKTKSV